VLDGEGAVRLTAEEHAGLVEHTRTTDEAENRERLNLYLAGHRDCFAYLKKIGLL
jgi:dsDNA-binding SOS-regulon protein